MDELDERFGSPAPEEAAHLLALRRMHGLSVDELFFKWEAYCIRMAPDLSLQDALTGDRLRAFAQSLQDSLERRRDVPKAAPKTMVGATPRAKKDVFGLLGVATPAPSTPTPTSTSKPKPTPGAYVFSARTRAGEVVEVLNGTLPAWVPAVAVPAAQPRVKLTAASDQKKLNYRPFALKVSESSEALDDRIEDFAELFGQHYGSTYATHAFGSAAAKGTAEIIAIGRIAADAPSATTTTTTLGAKSVLLETSRRTGGGLRVPLDLSRLPRYAFFPGQVVALRGANKTGSAFVVSEILPPPLLPSAASTPAALAVHRNRLLGRAETDTDTNEDTDMTDPPPLEVLLAAGPYTADDNLDYEPLHALADVAVDRAVDAVVLAGPFVDADHPLVATGDFDLPADAMPADAHADDVTMATVFRALVAPALQRIVAGNPTVTIVLVPSVRDVLAKHAAWPQPAFSRRGLGLPPNVRIVGNPVAVSLNEVVLGTSTQDILYELRHEELVHGSNLGTDPMARAARYLLEQRHFFPLFPPTDRHALPATGTDGLATGAMLDTRYLGVGDMVNVRPDVLLVPSALPPCARVVESTVVVNPGALSKRRGPGTYARMTVYPLPADSSGGDDMVGHRVFDRARVEITRI